MESHFRQIGLGWNVLGADHHPLLFIVPILPQAVVFRERDERPILGIGFRHHTHYLNLLPQTDQTLGWVTAELQHDFQAPPEDKHFYFLDLSRLLCRADIRLAAQHEPEILRAPHFGAQERSAFRERLEMLGWDAEKCWQALHHLCEANKDKNSSMEFDLGHALRIIEALARQPHGYHGQVVAVLTQEVHDFRHDVRKWLQPLMAILAGEMRLEAAIPSLVGNLGHPYSFLADQSMFALAKIGTEEIVFLVCDQFPGASRDFRLWASDLLGKIHLDVTVQRVLELRPDETELIIRINLSEALIDHFSTEGIEPARQLIKQHKLTPDVRRLQSNLIACCKIMETRFPEFDMWEADAKKAAQDERTKMQELRKMASEAGGDMEHLIQKLSAQVAEKQAEVRRLEAELAEEKQLLARKASPRLMSASAKPARIGRNDSCPCGSGKKFKHCCMKR